ncbi:hypothetical protein C8Q80DRAFT_1272796 [Daedaleopsis nitida]|nr:hypothetical protein C8Q80DRAFT_1272796 [Daedaleopsis nitida]
MSLAITPSAPLQPVDVPGEIIQSIVDCLVDDPRTLDICSLISHSWLPFSRYCLFRDTICHIKHSSSLDDFISFFQTSSNIVPYVRSLRLAGGPCEPPVTLAIEDLHRVLQTFFQLKRLAIERLTLSSRAHPGCDDDSGLPALTIPTVALAELRLCRISYDHATARAFGMLKTWVACSNPSYCLSMAAPCDVKTFQAFVDSFGPRITSLSLNALGYLVPLKLWLRGYSEDDADSLGEREFVSLAPCTTLTELVLYITSAGGLDDDSQFIFYWAALQAIVASVASAPRDTLRRVMLRFQRCGPHTARAMRVHAALRDPPDPRGWVNLNPELWKVLEDALLALPALEALVCVLCDGGFVREWKTLLSDLNMEMGALLEGAGSCSPQDSQVPLDEYRDYVAFLETAFPRLQKKGLLHFQQAES